MRQDGKHKLADELGKRRPFDLPEQEVYLNLLRTADALAGEFAQLFKQHGLTDAQYNALRILRGHGCPIPTRWIAEEMVTREPDITRLIDRLERAGLVRRERSKTDRRVVRVRITAKGTALLAKLDRPVLALHRRQLGHLGERKLASLSRLLSAARRPPTASA
jgi:DNA-binding MarR family transcriptional regulator